MNKTESDESSDKYVGDRVILVESKTPWYHLINDDDIKCDSESSHNKPEPFVPATKNIKNVNNYEKIIETIDEQKIGKKSNFAQIILFLVFIIFLLIVLRLYFTKKL